jgi:hypothetical protein
MRDAHAYGGARGPKAVKIAFGLHAHNAPAIRTSVSTQIHTLGKSIKKGGDKPMAPHLYRTTAGAALRPLPIEMSTLAINLIENN